eukprot:TRINITY_DN113354_c0_g1_i1.p1 TRINITY_DN113354_c0_g1~~TRINITY_DN113354_c0_g1_i1.p1  ORF type:complete len:234 (-),score=66.26 TRINITY_DN113354_c0_g1_i1:60-761(-)
MACAAAAATGAMMAQRKLSGQRMSAHWAVCSREIPLRKRLYGSEARELQTRKKKEEAFATKVLNAYDEDGSGFLEIEELRFCLRDYASEVFKREVEPSEDDLDFLLFLCSEDMKAAAFAVHELLKALKLWDDMLTYTPKISRVIKRRDSNGDGYIDRRELALFMLEINEGNPVDARTLDWIMQMGDLSGDGVLGPPELVRAIAAWYGHVEPTSGRASSADGSGGTSSKCCAIL